MASGAHRLAWAVALSWPLATVAWAARSPRSGGAAATQAASISQDVAPPIADDGVVDGVVPVLASLVADAAAVTPGDRFRLGVLLHMAPGWHIYSAHPGGAGTATQVQWAMDGATIAPLPWPVPDVFREGEAPVTYGYAGSVLLTAAVTVAEDARGTISAMAHVEYLACNIICSPGEARVTRNVVVGQASLATDAATRELFAHFDAKVPRPAAALGMAVHAAFETPVPLAGARSAREFGVVLDIVPQQAAAPAWRLRREPFVPGEMPGLLMHVSGTRPSTPDHAGAQLLLRGEILETVRPAAQAHALIGTVLLQSGNGTLQPLQLDVPLPWAEGAMHFDADGVRDANVDGEVGAEPGTKTATRSRTEAGAGKKSAATYACEDEGGPGMRDGEVSSATGTSGHQPSGVWLRAAALALLGGLLLNLMPCVLPVLALKALFLLQTSHAGTSLGERLRHGLAYAGGVVGSLTLLATLVCVLRAGGTAVGWGFQFQEPWFLAAVTGTVVLFALNCFGVFELYVGASGVAHRAEQAGPLGRSVLDGVLAVMLATPCSAPYLGPAIALALGQGSVVTYLTFAATGVGLAAPYVALVASPGLGRFVPRPGRWMLHLKTSMGFVLLLTAVWLIWIMGRLRGADSMARLLVAAVATAAGIWALAQASPLRPSLSLGRFGAFLACAGLGGYAGLHGTLVEAPATEGAAQAAPSWTRFSPAALQATLTEGRAAFVDFTADWCLTCQFNERHVLADGAVLAAMARHRVTLMRADWTQRDDNIRQTLAHFGRGGVPMYLLYGPKPPHAAQLLPEILSIRQLLEALDRLP